MNVENYVSPATITTKITFLLVIMFLDMLSLVAAIFCDYYDLDPTNNISPIL